MSVKMIEGDDQARAQKCGAEIKRILDMYDCTLVPQLTMMAGQIQHTVAIGVKDRKQPVTGQRITLPVGMKLE